MWLRTAVLGGLAVLALPGLAGAADTSGHKSVLVLYAEARILHAVADVDEEIRATFRASSSPMVQIYAEYVDASWFPEAGYGERLSSFLRQKYTAIRLDLIIVAGGGAFRFMVRHHADLFPDVPALFVTVSPELYRSLAADSVPWLTGVWQAMDAGATLDTALQLQPDVRRVVIARGSSRADRANHAEIRQGLERHAGRVEIVDLPELPLEDLVRQVAALPRDTVLLVGSILRDGAGRNLVPAYAFTTLAAAASVPTYTVFETLVGRGAVGGRMISFRAQGRVVAEQALRVLRGESVAREPASGEATNRWVFDSRELRRWGLDERRLPPGSEVRHRAASGWALYGWYVLTGAGLLVVETALIVALLVHRRRRTRTEQALADQLRLEALLRELSTAFSDLPVSEVDATIERALRQLVEQLRLDRATLAELTTDGASIVHSAVAPGIEPLPPLRGLEQFPWTARQLRHRQIVHFSRLAEVPPDAAIDRLNFVRFGTRSMAAIPLTAGGSIIGALALNTIRAERSWSPDLLGRLHLMADIFAAALVRRRTEAALQESEDEVRRQREELAHAQRLAISGELASSLAHEINQPLLAIMSNAHATQRLLDRPSPDLDEARAAVGDIAGDAQRAADVIRSLRAMVGKRGTERRPLDLNELVARVARLVRAEIERRDVRVALDLAPDVPSVLADPVQIQQVILNLLVNGSEAMAGSVNGSRQLRVDTSRTEKGQARIAIGDAGSGFAEETLERMFDPFVSTKPEGLGLGLSISRSIVEAHGGRIWATRNVGPGLTVHVVLPPALAEARTA